MKNYRVKEYKVDGNRFSQIISDLYSKYYIVNPVGGLDSCLEIKAAEVCDGKIVGSMGNSFARIKWDKDNIADMIVQFDEPMTYCVPPEKGEPLTAHEQVYEIIKPYTKF